MFVLDTAAHDTHSIRRIQANTCPWTGPRASKASELLPGHTKLDHLPRTTMSHVCGISSTGASGDLGRWTLQCSFSGAVAREESILERTDERAMALASHATGPLAAHFGPWVSSLIDKQEVSAVVYFMARHGAACDRIRPRVGRSAN